MMMSERELMGRIADGCHESFTVLYERWESKLRLFMTRLDRFANPDDLLQVVWMRVYTRASLFGEPYDFWHWIKQVARRELFSSKKKTRYSDKDVSGDEEIYDRNSTDVSEKEPLEWCVLQEDAARIESVLPTLSEDVQSVFCLNAFGGMSLLEISNVLQIPLGTAKSRYRMAKEKITQRVGELQRASENRENVIRSVSGSMRGIEA